MRMVWELPQTIRMNYKKETKVFTKGSRIDKIEKKGAEEKWKNLSNGWNV